MSTNQTAAPADDREVLETAAEVVKLLDLSHLSPEDFAKRMGQLKTIAAMIRAEPNLSGATIGAWAYAESRGAMQ